MTGCGIVVNVAVLETHCSVGASADPASVTMVDSVKIYVKTKETFGWPEDSEDFPEPAQPKPPPAAAAAASNGLGPLETVDTSICTPMPITSMDR